MDQPTKPPRKRRIETWHWQLCTELTADDWRAWQPRDLEISNAMHNLMAHGYVERQAVHPKPRRGAQYQYRLTAAGVMAYAATQAPSGGTVRA